MRWRSKSPRRSGRNSGGRARQTYRSGLEFSPCVFICRVNSGHDRFCRPARASAFYGPRPSCRCAGGCVARLAGYADPLDDRADGRGGDPQSVRHPRAVDSLWTPDGADYSGFRRFDLFHPAGGRRPRRQYRADPSRDPVGLPDRRAWRLRDEQGLRRQSEISLLCLDPRRVDGNGQSGGQVQRPDSAGGGCPFAARLDPGDRHSLFHDLWRGADRNPALQAPFAGRLRGDRDLASGRRNIGRAVGTCRVPQWLLHDADSGRGGAHHVRGGTVAHSRLDGGFRAADVRVDIGRTL